MKVSAVILLLTAVFAQGRVIPELVDPIVYYPELLKSLGLDAVIPSTGRIVGGTEATPHSVPWQCALFINGLSFCGCSIISDQWILTAAHCTDTARNVVVVLGAHYINDGNEATQIRISTNETIVHEEWKRIGVQNDVSVIRLPSPITFNENIQPICLAPANAPSYDGDMLTVTGWGKDADSANGVSPVLRTVDAPGMSWVVCNETFGIVTDKILCIDTMGGKSSCSGDSGGPLTTQQIPGVTDYTTVHQVGIVSFGSSAGCELNYPAGFTRVSSYIDWIQTNTGNAATECQL